MVIRNYLFILSGIIMLVLSGCSATITGNVVSEQGCVKSEVWCESLSSCIEPWEQYCPFPGESVKLITANECEASLSGRPVDYGNGNKCAPGELVQGEIAGLLSLHVCCVPQ